MIPTARGNHLLMMNGFTFHKDRKTLNYYCSKIMSGCKARVKLSVDGEVREANCNHTHEPPKYYRTPKGQYIKMSFVHNDTVSVTQRDFADDEGVYFPQRQQKLELLLLEESSRMQGSGEVVCRRRCEGSSL
ncbi:uncharacterized protein LOC114362945 isoform X2 [Ostrinia furnacalis]|uniref:uncharacterized protein LOC114362945 isoform X2 n=1 Tax=Ostrinia furnacalis TaxID=93504 RepID=UPI00103FF64A|nr:uncharacterized protein LOC114362945 isoform X2 [Ostrinia furnacalis]XP_028174333.1 uncharacterized protein LOC114362945 isoform X2 [Ostrinia furnacalis]